MPVEIKHAAAKALRLKRGNSFDDFLFGEQARFSESVAEGEHVIDFHADAVEGGFPPDIVRDDEGKIVNQVRGVVAENAALLEGFHDERDVALLEISDAAMNELGGSAGGALAEIALLKQADGISARSRVNGDADTGRAAADDGDVPGVGFGEEIFE